MPKKKKKSTGKPCRKDFACSKSITLDNGLAARIVPQGSIIFRWAQDREMERDPDRPWGYMKKSYRFPKDEKPLFFSHLDYANIESDTCRAFLVKKDLLLLDIYSSYWNLEKLSKMLSEDEMLIFRLITGFGVESNQLRIPTHKCRYPGGSKRRDEIFTCPQGFLTEQDETDEEYTNSKLVRIVCKLGFDGWIVTKSDVPQYTEKGFGRYPQEIALCKPTLAVEWLADVECPDLRV